MKSHRLITTLGFALTSTAALAGGAGYNGPITAGEALPIQLDRAIKLEQLTKTLNKCAAVVAKDIVRQLARLTPAEFDKTYKLYNCYQVDQSPWSFDINERRHLADFRHMACDGYEIIAGPRSYYWANYTIMNGFRNVLDESSSNEKYASLSNFYIDKSNRRLSLEEIALPSISFDDTYTEAAVNELGEIDWSTVLVSNLKLNFPESYKEEEFLVNQETGKPTSLKVSRKPYVDCIFNEISK